MPFLQAVPSLNKAGIYLVYTLAQVKFIACNLFYFIGEAIIYLTIKFAILYIRYAVHANFILFNCCVILKSFNVMQAVLYLEIKTYSPVESYNVLSTFSLTVIYRLNIPTVLVNIGYRGRHFMFLCCHLNI